MFKFSILPLSLLQQLHQDRFKIILLNALYLCGTDSRHFSSNFATNFLASIKKLLPQLKSSPNTSFVISLKVYTCQNLFVFSKFKH